jgi:cytochrome c-type biogenesis protein CcmH
MKRVVLAWILATSFIAFMSTNARAQSQPGAAALESRLYAPCCYNGTLDVHESELARELRKEIEARLSRGEASDAIQADFVARYGDRVVAARSDRPIRAMGLWLLALMAASGIGLGLVLRRWVRQPSNSSNSNAPVVRPTRDEFDDRLDAELAELD